MEENNTVQTVATNVVATTNGNTQVSSLDKKLEQFNNARKKRKKPLKLLFKDINSW